MENPTRLVASALLLNALLFGLVFAQSSQNAVTGDVNGDEYFVGSAFFQGVTLPDNLDGETGTSTYDFGGTGTVTVASKFGGGFPRLILNAGGTIESTRVHDESDVNHSWWEGDFTAPGLGSKAYDVDGDDSVYGDDITDFIVEGAFEVGFGNETFNFSPAAVFVADVGQGVTDGSKLYVAPRQDGNFVLDPSTYCWVEDGYCAVELSSASSFALIREVFGSCPRRNEVFNGSISGVPSCLLTCDKGYEFEDPEVRRYCVPTEGGSTDDEFGGDEFGDDFFGDEGFEDDFVEPAFDYALPENFEEDPTIYPSGYIRPRETRAGYDREIDLDGLSSEEKSRAELLNASSLKTVGSGSSNQAGDSLKVDPERDNFLNYILALRGTGARASEAEVKTAQFENENENDGSSNVASDENLYGSAPLLPSTGSGFLWILAAAGVALMSFAAVRRN